MEVYTCNPNTLKNQSRRITNSSLAWATESLCLIPVSPCLKIKHKNSWERSSLGTPQIQLASCKKQRKTFLHHSQTVHSVSFYSIQVSQCLVHSSSIDIKYLAFIYLSSFSITPSSYHENYLDMTFIYWFYVVIVSLPTPNTPAIDQNSPHRVNADWLNK